MKKKFYFFVLLFTIIGNVHAQVVGSIVGNITIDTSETRSILLVSLISADSVSIKTSLVDSSGNFIIYIPRFGIYKIKIERQSYKTYYSKIFKIDSTSSITKIDLGKISIEKDFHTLSPVAVFGKKNFIEHKFNKIIINVEQSVFAQGNSVFELLPILPGIKVDPSGNIKIHGKTNVLFQVDGKGQIIPGEQASEMLKSISASTIEKIEIINNPSARYDASVGAVINIVTLKKKTKSDVHAAYGSQFFPISERTGLADSYNNIGANVNVKLLGASVNSSLDFRKNVGFEQNLDNIDFKTITTELLRSNNSISHTNSENINFISGLNYNINKKQFVDIRINTNQYLNADNNNNTNIDFLLPGNMVPDSSILSLGKTGYSKFYSNTVNGKYVLQLKKNGEELAFYIDYNNYSYNRIGAYHNTILHFIPAFRSDSSLLTNWLYNVSITSFKTDYTYPINKNLLLDAGAKLSIVHNKSDYEQNQNPNNFRYKELISAGYLNLRNEADKFSYELGVRFENTESKGLVLNMGSGLSRSYFNFFPTITTQYTINKNDNISLSYKSTIVRPTYADFNPVPILYSPFNIYRGNDNLNPKITNTLQFIYVHKNYSVTLINDYAKDVNGSMIDSTSTTYYIDKSIFSYNHVNQTSIELDIPVKFGPKWSSNNSISGYFTSARLANGKINNYASFDFNINNSFKISSSLNLNFILTYSYYDQFGYDKTFPILNGIVAFQKSWKDKFILNVNLKDILGSAKLRFTRDYGYIVENTMTVNNNRNFRVSLKYLFNSGVLFSKKDKKSKNSNDEIRF